MKMKRGGDADVSFGAAQPVSNMTGLKKMPPPVIVS
jgi:hypothetical protein